MKHNLFKGGQKKSKLYCVWDTMKQRCLNENSQHYKNYGGRGITLCPSWYSYLPFHNWAIGAGYKEGLVLDRIDNDQGYYPLNCRWVNWQGSTRNRRNVFLNKTIADEIRLLYNSGKYSQRELGIKFDIGQSMVSQIVLNQKWR